MKVREVLNLISDGTRVSIVNSESQTVIAEGYLAQVEDSLTDKDEILDTEIDRMCATPDKDGAILVVFTSYSH